MKEKKELEKVGRPTKIVPEVVGKLEEALKDNATVEQACAYAGISKTIYYDRIKADPDFLTKMEAAKNYTSLVSKRNIREAVDNKDLETSKWHLSKTDYAQGQTQVNIAGKEMKVEFIAYEQD